MTEKPKTLNEKNSNLRGFNRKLAVASFVVGGAAVFVGTAGLVWPEKHQVSDDSSLPIDKQVIIEDYRDEGMGLVLGGAALMSLGVTVFAVAEERRMKAASADVVIDQSTSGSVAA